MKDPIKLNTGLYLQAVILLLALFGALYSFLWSFELPVLSGVINVVLILYGVLFLFAYSQKRWWITLCVSGAAMAAWAFYHAEVLSWAALNLFRQLLNQFNEHSSWSFISIPDTGFEPGVQLQLDTQLILLIVFFWAAALGYLVIRRPSLTGLMLLTLPFAGVPLIFMIVPPLPALACLMASYVMLEVFCLNTGVSPFLKLRREKRKKSAAALSFAQCITILLVLPMVLLSVVLSSFMLPQQDYNRPESVDRLRVKVEEFFFGNTLGNGLRMGSLNNLGSLHFTGRTVLKVKSTSERPLYLRGYAGSIYDGDSWKILAEEDYEQAMGYPIPPNPQNYYAENFSFWLSRSDGPAETQSRESYKLSIKNLSSDKSVLFLPNGLITDVSDLGNTKFVQDVYGTAVSPGGMAEYTLRAFSVEDAPSVIKFGSTGEDVQDLEQLYLMPGQEASAEGIRRHTNSDGLLYSDFSQMLQTYRRYVYSTYTSLPEETEQSAEALRGQYRLNPVFSDDGTGLSLNLRQTCNQIASLLDERCEYSNQPKVIPGDEDFAAYFLNESREGYCVHFATTAAVLLRSMGIPARYAEGYVVTGSDYDQARDNEGYISIVDSRAHAWVEVFDPVQMEWFPVEMTPSFTTAEGLALEESRSNGLPSSAPQPSVSKEEPVPRAVTEPAYEEPVQETGTPEINTNAGSSALLYLSFAGIFAVIIVLTGIFRRKIICSRRQKLLHQKDIDSAVLEGSRWIMAMLLSAGCHPPGNLDSPEDYETAVSKKLPSVNILGLADILCSVQKARFSNAGCTETERQAVIHFGNTLAEQLSGSFLLKQRFQFCYIKCLN